MGRKEGAGIRGLSREASAKTENPAYSTVYETLKNTFRTL